MKLFLDIIIAVFALNIVLSLFAQIGLGGDVFDMKTTEVISDNGVALDPNSMSYKVREFATDPNNVYQNSGVANPNQLYMQSGGDFIRGMLNVWNLIGSSTIMIGSTLRNVGVPSNLLWFFLAPIYTLYGVGFIQFVSNRSFEGMT